MSRFNEFFGRRKGTLYGCGLGVVLAFAFLGQSYREVQRFAVDPNDPPVSACLGLTSEECVAEVTSSNDDPPDNQTSEETRHQPTPNEIGDQQRREARERTTTTTRSTSSQPSPSSPSTTAPSGRPSPTTPTPPPSSSPSPSPAPSTSRPQPTTPPRRPSPPPTATVTPTQPNRPTVPATPSVPTTPTVPQVPSVPDVPPVVPPGVTVCTPFAGVNCPPGSRQAERVSNRGPGDKDDPIDPGEEARKYDVDPTVPSDEVNGTNTGNNGEDHD